MWHSISEVWGRNGELHDEHDEVGGCGWVVLGAGKCAMELSPAFYRQVRGGGLAVARPPGGGRAGDGVAVADGVRTAWRAGSMARARVELLWRQEGADSGNLGLRGRIWSRARRVAWPVAGSPAYGPAMGREQLAGDEGGERSRGWQFHK